MKSLVQYLSECDNMSCVVATPGNTLGADNPCAPDPCNNIPGSGDLVCPAHQKSKKKRFTRRHRAVNTTL